VVDTEETPRQEYKGEIKNFYEVDFGEYLRGEFEGGVIAPESEDIKGLSSRFESYMLERAKSEGRDYTKKERISINPKTPGIIKHGQSLAYGVRGI